MEIATMDDFKRLENKVSATQQMLSDLIDLIGEPVLSITDIAKREGVSKAQLYREPWRFPNFGQSDFATGRKRWRLKTYCRWIERDDFTREQEWNNMRLTDREKIVTGNF